MNERLFYNVGLCSRAAVTFLAFLAVLVGSAPTAHAATRLVNALGDVDDGTCDATHCSLREAAGSADPNDSVAFDFSGGILTPPFEIELDASLTISAGGVTVDGFDCTGCGAVTLNTNWAADGFNSILAIRIVPSLSYSGGDLISITGDDVGLFGLNIDGGPDDGVGITGDDVSIQDCWIGTSITGQTGLGNNDDGLDVLNAAYLEVVSCLISGNGDDGIEITGQDSDYPTLQTNIVGLDITATTAIANDGRGIRLVGSGDSILAPTIGGLAPSQGNVISGNGYDGIRIQDSVDGNNLATANADGVIGFNIVGTNGAVTAAVPNSGNGLELQGGLSAGMEPKELWVISNVFSGNDEAGVFISGAKQAVFHSNAIGTNPAGTLQLGNSDEGIYFFGSAVAGSRDTKQHVIGGAGVENEIAYNSGQGIRVRQRTVGLVKDNRIDANSIHDNGLIGIDLAQAFSGTGVSAGLTCTSDDTWGNQGMAMPVITSSTVSGGVLTVVGTGCSAAVVDLYLADGDSSGYGEPETFVTTGTVDGSGSWSIAQAVSGVVNSTLVTAVQRRADGDTSEAALNVFTDGPCDVDGDGADSNTGGTCLGVDCDDNDATVYTGAPELCDGLDNGCNGSVPTNEFDLDSDGFSPCQEDCNDSDILIFPGQTEACNGVDDDCNGVIPSDETDDDADTFNECADGDCDDNDSSVFVGATEVCDAVDQDCDTVIDDGFDADTDTVTTCGPDGVFLTADDDCDDTEITVFPGATEIPDDGVDQDCSGSDTITCFEDNDTDGVGSAITFLASDGDCTDTFESATTGDCNDNDILVFPGQTEICNGVDDDCSGALNADEADADSDGEMTCAGDCDDAAAGVNSSATEVCNSIDDDCDTSVDEGFDFDTDGFTTCGADGVAGNADDDCDDIESSTFPGATEICDAADQDCDGLIDEGFDSDGDTVTGCGPDGLFSTSDDDCDDSESTVFPGATEIPDDGIDQDCSGADTVACFEDGDGDGVGGVFTLLATDGDCTDAYESATTGDCDDDESTTFPGATEICDGVDQDCDTDIDEDFDADSDGYPIGASCTVTVDCDDTNAAINPAATELCDGVDNNCNGTIDEDADADNDGYTNCQGDCDDNEATINPGATELCDGADTDCDSVLPLDEFDDDSDGEMPCDGDCDDTNAAVNTSATEVCNAIDDDCDSSVDEGFDIDGDLVTTCGPDGVASTADDDCDDGSATVLPGATEICDAIDQDCDGTVDEGFDVDGDGVTTCGADGFSGTTDDDCDDTDATALPGGTEIPDDGIDQDCSGADTVTCFVDLDDDGVGTTPVLAGDGNCTDAGEAAITGDCDDGASTVFPGASELCNGIDEDCDAAIDEDFDGDGDGYPIGASCTVTVDCDDGDAAINPGATEVCDLVDNNCDGTIDEQVDSDSDGFTGCDGDCDDNDDTVYPSAIEVCDGLDNDCDGSVPADETDDDGDGFDECADGDCDDAAALVFPGATEVCDGADTDCDGAVPADEADGDGDTYLLCADDCDDADAATNPGALELCDGEDNDCDGAVPADEVDGDTDGYRLCDGDCDDGDASVGPGSDEDGDGSPSCEDCDDADPLTYPDADELCDGIDNDCDGSPEDPDDLTFYEWYEDLDGDGFGDPDAPHPDNPLCAPPPDYVSDGLDCDDAAAAVNPDATEVCNGIDDDCDPATDLEGTDADADGDGFLACDPTEPDCDDNDPDAWPGAAELCGDEVDNDCDGKDGGEVGDPDCWERGCTSCGSVAPPGRVPPLLALLLVGLIGTTMRGRRSR